MNILRLAWLNLARHRAATALAVLALGLTVACAGMLLRTARLAESRFATLAHAGDALIAAKGGATDALLGALNTEGPYPRFIPLRLFATLVNETWYTAGGRPHARSPCRARMAECGMVAASSNPIFAGRGEKIPSAAHT